MKWLQKLANGGFFDYTGSMTLPITPTGRIEIKLGVMSGKPVIRGTRITVEIVLRRIADGYTVPELLDDWPDISADDIRDALEYAVRHLPGSTRELA